MSKKQLLYKDENEAFLRKKEQEGVKPLAAGVLHEVLQVGLSGLGSGARVVRVTVGRVLLKVQRIVLK